MAEAVIITVLIIKHLSRILTRLEDGL
jgi:hypothetical protein